MPHCKYPSTCNAEGHYLKRSSGLLLCGPVPFLLPSGVLLIFTGSQFSLLTEKMLVWLLPGFSFLTFSSRLTFYWVGGFSHPTEGSSGHQNGQVKWKEKVSGNGKKKVTFSLQGVPARLAQL